MKRANVRVPQADLDQVLPDPVKQELEQLKKECAGLRAELDELKKQTAFKAPGRAGESENAG